MKKLLFIFALAVSSGSMCMNEKSLASLVGQCVSPGKTMILENQRIKVDSVSPFKKNRKDYASIIAGKYTFTARVQQSNAQGHTPCWNILAIES